MISLFIYPSSYKIQDTEGSDIIRPVTVIFCERFELELAEVQGAIKSYYEINYQTEEIFVLCGKYNKNLVKTILIDNQEEAFKDIPKLNAGHLAENLHLLVFDKSGKIASGNGKTLLEADILEAIFRDGLTKIFKDRGGLIEANGSAHHFVFPSGKHSNKFLRTGNVLLHSSEIYFIAFHLLKFYKDGEHKKILCDTSSINTIAFALLDLLRKLIGSRFNPVSVISFSSYEGIFSNKIKFFHNSLILISSSTSGNIIEKLVKHDSRIDPFNIVILYFLGPRDLFGRHKEHIICDLTKSEGNLNGITYYDTYTDRDCIFCKKGSYPVEVKGDVFLLERPKIRKIMLKVTDAPKGLSPFIQQFKSTAPESDNVFKVNYKDGSLNANNKYEVYFDMLYVLTNIEKYKKFDEKLNDYVNQYIPNNVKYLICLPDDGSKKLAEIILHKITSLHNSEMLPEIKLFEAIPADLQNKEEQGAIVIVASCISNGKNLLYLSRALRGYEKMKLVYFVGLSTTSDVTTRNTLKSNLSQGKYGKDTNTIVEVESFYFNKDSKNTSWIREKDFINEVLEHFEENDIDDYDLSYLKRRIDYINASMGNQERGLANNLFFVNTKDETLQLRKGFAFWNFENYSEKVSQADVYFTISTIINNLRYADSQEQTLKQTEFVRNLLDPGNFHRYNDGIIQACILRAAHASEICYHIDDNLSSYMLLILEKIISDHHNDQGEGLLEFLYAISIQKLTLKKEHLRKILPLLDNINNNSVAIFRYWIKEVVIKQKTSQTEQIRQLKEEVLFLKGQLQTEQIRQ